jgi:hypothetical protein
MTTTLPASVADFPTGRRRASPRPRPLRQQAPGAVCAGVVHRNDGQAELGEPVEDQRQPARAVVREQHDS